SSFVDHRRPTLAHRCRRGAVTSSKPVRTPKADTNYQKLILRLSKEFKKQNLVEPRQCNRIKEITV
ncbi:hypothetical protein AB2B41_18565, partial [Marimonas sp. MJW-29]